ncbi:MAG: type II toxin-antitoxin system Phd/YefM family antitoxin [bacterium]
MSSETWIQQGGKGMGRSKTQYIVDEKGGKTSTIIPIKEYEELLEDIHDLAVIAERRDETTVSFEKVKE